MGYYPQTLPAQPGVEHGIIPSIVAQDGKSGHLLIDVMDQAFTDQWGKPSLP